MQAARALILPVLLAACGGLSACTTQQAARTPATSFAAVSVDPTAVAVLPESAPIPGLNGAAGTADDAARSLAREVEMNAGASPAGYAGSTPASPLPETSKVAVKTVPVPSLAEAEPQQQAEAPPAGEPMEEETPSVVAAVANSSAVKAVVDVPVEAAKVTLASLGSAAEAIPKRFGRSDDEVTHTRPAPEGRLGPQGGVEARSPELDDLMQVYADYYEIPVELVRKVAKRESTFNPKARNGIYMGLMQISPATARGMGYRGAPTGLLDAETNLKYAVRYLRGAYVVAKGNHGVADRLYQTGYYYHAKRAGLLDETGVGVDRKKRRRL